MKIKERLKIYKKSLKDFKKRSSKNNDILSAGFCYYFKYTIDLDNDELYKLKELYKYKPKVLFGHFWFRQGKLIPRIKILKRAIKLAKIKIKNKE